MILLIILPVLVYYYRRTSLKQDVLSSSSLVLRAPPVSQKFSVVSTNATHGRLRSISKAQVKKELRQPPPCHPATIAYFVDI